MKRFIVITLALIIVYLLIENRKIFAKLIVTIADQFNQSFKAVTSAESF